MRAGNVELELLLIRTLCAGKPAALYLMNNLRPEHFYYPTTKMLFRRLKNRLAYDGAVPSWNDLLNDSTIPEDKRANAQRTVRLKNIKPLVSQAKGESAFANADRFRKLRAFFETMNKAGAQLRSPTADIDDLLRSTKSELISIDVNMRGAPVTIDGNKSSNVKNALTNRDSYLPTGLLAYDSKSGGINAGAVFIIGADTGGYKSVTMMQIALNMAREGRKCGFYSLEMTTEQILRRVSANVAQVSIQSMIRDFEELRKVAEKKGPKELAKVEEEIEKRAAGVMRKYEENAKAWDGNLHYTCPAEEVSMDWVLQQAELTDRDVIFIDYIGLLSGLDKEDQWRAMSNVVRAAKIWTNRTGKTIILAAQMRYADGKPELKYSKAILDHAHGAWFLHQLFVSGRNYLCFYQMKSREGSKFPFIMRVIPEQSRMCDLIDETDRSVALLAIEDMLGGADPNKRYGAGKSGQQNKKTEVENQDEDDLPKRNAFGPIRVRPREAIANSNVAETDDLKGRLRKAVKRNKHSEILNRAKQQTRVIALSKLGNPAASLTREEAAYQAQEVLARYEEAKANHRVGVVELTKEILGLSDTQSLLDEIRHTDNNKRYLKSLSKDQREIHAARIKIIKEAQQALKSQGREYLSEEDFYEKDDLVLAVERGEEPIADPFTLDRSWEENSIAWADQPAITLPNSAKPPSMRWGASKTEESLATMLKTAKSRRGSNNGPEIVLWPPNGMRPKDLHYLDDIQIDSVVDMAAKFQNKGINEVSLNELVDTVAKYVTLVAPGKSRVHKRVTKKVATDDAAFEQVANKYGIKL